MGILLNFYGKRQFLLLQFKSYIKCQLAYEKLMKELKKGNPKTFDSEERCTLPLWWERRYAVTSDFDTPEGGDVCSHSTRDEFQKPKLYAYCHKL